MNKDEVRSRIEKIGIIPSVRVSSSEDAMFAAEAIYRGGIPIVEVTLTVAIPGVDREIAQGLVDKAHIVCPYSNATRGNIDVTLNLA